MKLLESLPRLSEEKIWAIVADCCKTLSALGPDFEVSEVNDGVCCKCDIPNLIISY